MIRVSTPPRVITLDQHYFPSADDFPAELANSPPRSVRPMRSLGDGARSRTPIPDQFNESTMTESRLVLRYFYSHFIFCYEILSLLLVGFFLQRYHRGIRHSALKIIIINFTMYVKRSLMLGLYCWAY